MVQLHIAAPADFAVCHPTPPTTNVTLGPAGGGRGDPFVRLRCCRRDGLPTAEPGLPDWALKLLGETPPPSGSSRAANAHTRALVATGTAGQIDTGVMVARHYIEVDDVQVLNLSASDS